jgi:hypothetical protein
VRSLKPKHAVCDVVKLQPAHIANEEFAKLRADARLHHWIDSVIGIDVEMNSSERDGVVSLVYRLDGQQRLAPRYGSHARNQDELYEEKQYNQHGLETKKCC